MQSKNYYEELGLSENASKVDIKSAYRSLVKKHHPDVGGDKDKFVLIQNAWATLSEEIKKGIYDNQLSLEKKSRGYSDESWKLEFNPKQNISKIKDSKIKEWIKNVYVPSNKIITQIIKHLNKEIKDLSADPYDDILMDNFCAYIRASTKKINKVSNLYKTHNVPDNISLIGIDLYHCFSQVQDALEELDRYTHGYVDDYLFDGKEMMKEAKRIQNRMAENKKNISL